MDVNRSRSRVLNPSKGVLRIDFLDHSGNTISTDYLDQTSLGTNEEIYDVVHSNFSARSRAGEKILGPLSMSRRSYTVQPGSFEFPEGDYGTRFTGDMIPMFSMADTPDRSQRNSALSLARGNAAISALKKLNTAEVDMGENLGNLAQTVSMFRHPLAASQKLLSKMELRRMRLMRKRGGGYWTNNYVKATTNAWLEYSFGFRAIASDMARVCNKIMEDIEGINSAVRVARGAAQSSWTGNSDVSYYHRGETRHANTYADGSIFTQAKVKVGCGVYYSTPVGTRPEFLARGLGLGVHNLPVSAWNLLPYSWVVDQVFNVGDWIKGLTPDPDLIILAKWMTTVERETHDQTCRLSILRAKGRVDPPMWYFGNAGRRRETVHVINRVLAFGLPSHPQFRPVWPFLAQAVNDAAFGFNKLDRLLKRWSH